MARQARGEYLAPGEVQVVHAVQRCVRQAFLCGKDKYTGQSFEHRRDWIRQRMEFLASVFGIDCLTYTVLSNHLHVTDKNKVSSTVNGNGTAKTVFKSSETPVNYLPAYGACLNEGGIHAGIFYWSSVPTSPPRD